MGNKTVVLCNLQIIKQWAQMGKKEKPGINPIRCEAVEQWIDQTIELLNEQDTVEHALSVLKAHGWKENKSTYCPNCGAYVEVKQ